MWVKRKCRGMEGYQWTWKFERPFKEHNAMKDSRATVCRGVMEIWFNMHQEGIANEKRMAERVSEGFRELFNVEGGDICEVFSMLGFTRVAYYCRVSDPPKEELVSKVPSLVEDSYVEAEVDRYDADTGEYQGTYYLTEFDYNTRFAILKNINYDTDGKKKFRFVRGSKWKFAD